MDPLQPLLHLAGQADQVDAGAPAGGTGDQIGLPPLQAHRLQDILCRANLLHRVGGEGHPERVSDAEGQQAPDPHGRFKRTHTQGARLGHAEVQGIIAFLRHPAVGRHGDRYAGGLEGHADIGKVVPLQQGNVAEGGLHQRFGGHSAVFRQDGLFQRAAVDSDADGDAAPPAGLGHRFHPVFSADVAGVDAHLVAPRRNAFQGQPVVEVDIHHQRDGNALPNGAHGPCGGPVGHRHPDDLAARRLQAPDLLHGGRHVVGAGVGHGLDAHRGAAAHRNAADQNLFCHCPVPLRRA